jgi:signal transduction histidine kinase
VRPGSIRLRLVLAAAVSVIVALAIAGTGLTWLFERHVERRVAAELGTHLRQLLAGISVAADATVSIAGPADPRFAIPLSGLYWQVATNDGATWRSRSLWDVTLLLPDAAPVGGAVRSEAIDGPNGTRLLAVDRVVRVGAANGERAFRAVVGIDRSEVTNASREFALDLLPSLALLALALIAAAWVQIVVGLAPLQRIRSALAEVAAGKSSRVEASVPSEVAPLVDEINHLLADQEHALSRARSRAADLAHGIKTPLQVLGATVRTLKARGDGDLAGEIDQVASSIRRSVERELARARLGSKSAGGGRRTPLRPVVEGIVRVLERTARGPALAFEIEIPAGVFVAADETDLAEIIGNLGENACRFARTRIRVAARVEGDMVTIEVVDDGPGIPIVDREKALARGERLDSRGDGAGLGLAIVAETVEAVGGHLRLEDAGPGLRAVVRLPLAHRS